MESTQTTTRKFKIELIKKENDISANGEPETSVNIKVEKNVNKYGEDSVMNCVKMENNNMVNKSIVTDTFKEDIGGSQRKHEDIIVVSIKKENDTDETSNDRMKHVDCVLTEHNDVVKQEIDIGLNTALVSLHSSDVTDCINMGNNSLRLQSVSVESTSNYLDCKDAFIVDGSSSASLSTGEMRLIAKQSETVTEKTSSTEEKKRDNNKPIILCCEFCPFETKREDHYSSHLKAHSATNFHICNICGYKTYFKSKLTCHMRIHTNDKPHLCKICSKRFVRERQLKQHLAVHTGAKPYPCNVCKRKFSTKGSLETHRIVHLEKKPWIYKKTKDLSSSHQQKYKVVKQPFIYGMSW